jgi:hypothetical protein
VFTCLFGLQYPRAQAAKPALPHVHGQGEGQQLHSQRAGPDYGGVSRGLHVLNNPPPCKTCGGHHELHQYVFGGRTGGHHQGEDNSRLFGRAGAGEGQESWQLPGLLQGVPVRVYYPEQVLLARILKYSGKTRLTQLVESVTHCVHSVVTNNVATETSRLLEQLDLSPHMVSIQWVVESMRLGKPVTEAQYPFPPPIESESFRQELAPLPDTTTYYTRFEANCTDSLHLQQGTRLHSQTRLA